MATVAGLDLSLTGTGVAWCRDGAAVEAQVFESRPAGQELPARYRRLHKLGGDVLWELVGADLIVVEQPAYSRQTGHQHDRSGLWWLVVHTLIDRGQDVREVAPTALKRYLAGRGNAGKDEMVAAAVRRYPDVDVTRNDQADALGLAAMGARWLGEPVEKDLPQRQAEVVHTIGWEPKT